MIEPNSQPIQGTLHGLYLSFAFCLVNICIAGDWQLFMGCFASPSGFRLKGKWAVCCFAGSTGLFYSNVSCLLNTIAAKDWYLCTGCFASITALQLKGKVGSLLALGAASPLQGAAAIATEQ